MAENSKIEWTHHTINLWQGCEEVHPGCDHCYAKQLANRFNGAQWGNDTPRHIVKSAFLNLDKFNKKAKDAGEIHSVFIGSMMDIFEKPMPLVYASGEKVMRDNTEVTTGMLRDELFHNISIGRYPNLKLLLLTKRASNINKYIPEHWKTNPPVNVMFGASISDQKTADTIVPQLLQVNGLRFLSIEPMLGPIDLSFSVNGHVRGPAVTTAIEKIHWVICGGESGHNARPMESQWAIDLCSQCVRAGAPFFMKQMSQANWKDYKNFDSFPAEIQVRSFHDGSWYKKAEMEFAQRFKRNSKKMLDDFDKALSDTAKRALGDETIVAGDGIISQIKRPE